MQLLDDHMFKLWKRGRGGEARHPDARPTAPDELADKIARAERGMFEDEDEAGRRETERRNGNEE